MVVFILPSHAASFDRSLRSGQRLSARLRFLSAVFDYGYNSSGKQAAAMTAMINNNKERKAGENEREEALSVIYKRDRLG